MTAFIIEIVVLQNYCFYILFQITLRLHVRHSVIDHNCVQQLYILCYIYLYMYICVPGRVHVLSICLSLTDIIIVYMLLTDTINLHKQLGRWNHGAQHTGWLPRDHIIMFVFLKPVYSVPMTFACHIN